MLRILALLAGPALLFSTAPRVHTPDPASRPLANQDPQAPEADEYAPAQTEFDLKHPFSEPLVPYRGFDSLEDFRGRPVLVICWYLESEQAEDLLKDVVNRVGDRMPQIHTLLCDSSELPRKEHDQFLWNSGLLSTQIHCCREEAVPRNWHEFQAFVIDANGYVQWWGALDGDFESALDRTLESAAARVEYTDSKVQDGWEKFDQGKWSAAHRIGQQVRKKGLRKIDNGEPSVRGELDQFTQGELLSLAIEEAVLHHAERANRLLSAGQPAAAADLFDFVQDNNPPNVSRCEAALDELETIFNTRSTKKLVARDRTLNEILARAAGSLASGGNFAAEQPALEALIEESENDVVSKRAGELRKLFTP